MAARFSLDENRTAMAGLGVPVIEGVGAVVKLVEVLVSLGLGTCKGRNYAPPIPKPYLGSLAGFTRRSD